MEQLLPSEDALTARQRNEIEYHRTRAAEHAAILTQPFSFEVAEATKRRWWNGYWAMYTLLRREPLAGQRVLVIGCGFGDDALRLAYLGAEVYACDLSAESLALAEALAARENLRLHFAQMPAEELTYEADFFDCVIARDILHHVDIPQALAKIAQVAKHNALFVVNEIYSHSWLERIRHSRLVERHLYALLQNFVYEHQRPYITADERKLTEHDVAQIRKLFARIESEQHFNFLVTRLAPPKFTTLSKLDRLLLLALKPFGRILAGRILLAGRIAKPARLD